MERLQRVLFLSALFLALILALSTPVVESQQNKQFSHRRIQSGPPKFNRRPPPGPPHRPRRPNGPPPRGNGGGGGSGDRGPPRDRDRDQSYNNGGGVSDRGPPPRDRDRDRDQSYNNGGSNNNNENRGHSRDRDHQYNNGGSNDRGPPSRDRERDQYSGGSSGNGSGKYNQQRPQSSHHHHQNSDRQPSGPPPTRQYNSNNAPNSRPGPPYPSNDKRQNDYPSRPMHPHTQQSPTAPAPYALNAPVSTHNHHQQPMINPPISEYAPPLNTFKSGVNNYNKNSAESSPSSNSQSQQVNLHGHNNTKHTITFTVTKKPSGATAINFQIQTPQGGKNGQNYGPSTYRPPLDPSYGSNAGYTMKDKDESSSNDLLNPPPVFYSPQKDVMLNKDHPLNQRKNEVVHDPVKDYGMDSKFSQPDPLFHAESSKQSDPEGINDSSSSSSGHSPQVLIAGQSLSPKKNKLPGMDPGMDPATAAAQLLAALGLSKDPLISLPGQGEPMGLNDYLRSQPLFNKPDRIIGDNQSEDSSTNIVKGKNKGNKDQEPAQSQNEQFPNLYGDDFGSYSGNSGPPPPERNNNFGSGSGYGGNQFKDESKEQSKESKLSLYLQQRLKQLQQQGPSPTSSNDVSPVPQGQRGGPVSYIEQRLKGNNAPLNPFVSPPSNNNFGLLNNNNQGHPSYFEDKLKQQSGADGYGQPQSEQSYIQQLLNRNQNQKQPHHHNAHSDQNGAYAHLQAQQPITKPNLELNSQHRFGPSTMSPSSLEMEEYNDKTEGSGLYGAQAQQQQSQFSENRHQLAQPGSGLGSLPGNVLLPGGFGGTHLQQQQQQFGFQGQGGQNLPVFNHQQLPQQSPQFGGPAFPSQSPSPHVGSGSVEQGQILYNPQQQFPQETQQQFQQRLHFDQHHHHAPQYAAVNPLQQTPQQHNFPQQPLSQPSIQNFNYQQAPQHQQHVNPASQQHVQPTNLHPQETAPQAAYGPAGHEGGYNNGGGHGGGGFGNGGGGGFGGHAGQGQGQAGGGFGGQGGGGFGQGGGFAPTPAPQQQVFVVTEAEPIIEIIVQDSNVTLPPQHFPTLPPPTAPTPEPVHVFYVKYSENKFPGGPGGYGGGSGEPEINLESPIPSINVRGPGGNGIGGYGPERNLQVEYPGGIPHDNVPQLSEHHPVNVSSPPTPAHIPPPSSLEDPGQYSSTTLRTLINPSQNSFTNTKLAVHFDQPPAAYPFDMEKYQKNLEAQRQSEHHQQAQADHKSHHEQQQMHQQMYQHFQQNKDQLFLNKRIGVEEFSSLLQDDNQPQSQRQPESAPQQKSQHAPSSVEHQHQHQHHQQPHANQHVNQHTMDKVKELPPDVPHHLKQQLINSGILDNADVQVVNFDENLFKELSSLPPEAISALQQQQQHQAEFSQPHQSQQHYQQEDFSNLQKRHVDKIFIEKRPLLGKRRSLKQRNRSILFKTGDNHLYRLRLKSKSFANGKVDKIC